MDEEKLNAVLDSHEKWANNRGGTRADLYAVDLRGVDFSGRDLCAARFVYCNLQGANFSGAQLQSAYFSGSLLVETDFWGANICNATFSGVQMMRSTIRSGNAICANFAGADLSGSSLIDMTLRGANFHNAILHSTSLANSDMANANLTNANLTEAHMAGVNLAGAKGVRYALVAWPGHGSAGRMLTAMHFGDYTRYWCGCFFGNLNSLQDFIDTDWVNFAASRRKALWIVSDLLMDQ